MKFKTLNTIICSAAMSAVVVSAIFLAEIIRTANDLLLLPYLLVVAVIYAVMLLSENRKTLLLKWVLTLPFSFLCLEYFWQTHYSVRALNWMTEGYGKQSAGGNFAGFLFLVLGAAHKMLPLAGMPRRREDDDLILGHIRTDELVGIAIEIA